MTNTDGTATDARLALPRGSRDILPTEARELHALRRILLETFGSFGYVPVEPPILELARDAAGVDERRVLRFLDQDGSLLALRPDLTTAVARVVAQRYRDVGGILRLSYFTSVFRQEHSMRGSEREYDQAGVELIGPSYRPEGPAALPQRPAAPPAARVGDAIALADAEAILLLAEALSRCGLASAELDVGHAGFVGGLLEDLGPDAREEALARGRAGDLAGLVAVARAGGLTARRAEELRGALRHRGPVPAGDADLPGASLRALEELRALDALLAAAGTGLPLRYDLGLVPSLPYYTGVVFQAIAPGLGFPVASGGRYDDLLARYGAARPAIGFGIAVPHLHQALVLDGWRIDDGSPLVTLEGGEPIDVLRAATSLRREGLAVAIGGTADSAGRRVIPLRVLGDGRVEQGGRVTTLHEAASAVSAMPTRRDLRPSRRDLRGERTAR